MQKYYGIFDPVKASKVPVDVIRNVCILAHVDHGKTTLSDYLIASNGVISNQLAGNMRFLDSRSDEQSRLITMKSSCITLQYKASDLYWINLFDSPGHVDFSSEVYTAARLCDIALLLVDAVEGVCSQTRHVMHTAYNERLQLILVITKIDRLFLKLNLSPSEIYEHLDKLICDVNNTMQQFVLEEAMKQADINLEVEHMSYKYTQNVIVDEEMAKTYTFAPSQNNVIFSSSQHGWAFTMFDMAQIICRKLKLPEKSILKLNEALWGNYSINMKTFKITKHRTSSNITVLCAQMVFDQLFYVYNCFSGSKIDMEAVQKLKKSLQISIDSHILETENLSTSLKHVFSQWLPLAENILATIIRISLSPVKLAKVRINSLISHTTPSSFPENVLNSLYICDRSEKSPIFIYVPKFMSADLNMCRLTGDRLRGNEKLSGFVALGRIYSGTLLPGQRLYICPKTVETKCEAMSLYVRNIYFLLGSELIPTDLASAGCIIAISFHAQDHNIIDLNSQEGITLWIEKLKNTGQDDMKDIFSSVERSLTLCSMEGVPSFRNTTATKTSAMLRVCIEPFDVRETFRLLQGLAYLHKADPSVEINFSPNGEIMLGCQGEVHLEKCLNDLQYIYAGIPLRVSSHIISIREGFKLNNTTCSNLAKLSFPPWNPPSENEDLSLTVINSTSMKGFTFSVTAQPMPRNVLLWLDRNTVELQNIVTRKISTSQWNQSADYIQKVLIIEKKIQSLWTSESELTFQENDKINPPEDTYLQVNKFSPHNKHLLSLYVSEGARTLCYADLSEADVENTQVHLFLQAHAQALSRKMTAEDAQKIDNSVYCEVSKRILAWIPSITYGFQMASKAGPLCEEPMLCHVNECPSVSQMDSGHLMTCIRDTCKSAFLRRGCPRVYEALLKLELQCEQEYLGAVYGVLAKRRSEIFYEDLREGTSIFTIKAYVPVIDSFKLSTELRSKASGQLNISHEFSHWRMLCIDPFPEATMTMEEIEDNGIADYVQTSSANIARKIIYSIRKRKGLPLGEKVVKVATKQRTLTRNK